MREPYFESATPGTPSQDSGCHGCYGTTVALPRAPPLQKPDSRIADAAV